MPARCNQCNAFILAGGPVFLNQRFCGDACAAKFKLALVDKYIPQEVVEERVREVFIGRCPDCREQTHNDLYSSTRVTGMLLAYDVDSETHICCARCGRRNRLLAAAHCLLAGWWSPRAAFYKLFILPTNLIAACFVRPPAEPSESLRLHVKLALATALAPRLEAALQAADADPTPDDPST